MHLFWHLGLKYRLFSITQCRPITESDEEKDKKGETQAFEPSFGPVMSEDSDKAPHFKPGPFEALSQVVAHFSPRVQNQADKNAKANESQIQIKLDVPVVGLIGMPPVIRDLPNLLNAIAKPITFKSRSENRIFVGSKKKLPETSATFYRRSVAA